MKNKLIANSCKLEYDMIYNACENSDSFFLKHN